MSTNTKHTPGPWDVDYHTTSILPYKYTISSIQETGSEAEANARLIAAAPELLEALQIIANALSPNSLPVNGMMASYDHALMVREEADRAFEIAIAAIAKATGNYI